MNIDGFSRWQNNMATRHPLVCQICTRMVAGLSVTVIIAVIGWIIALPNPQVDGERLSKDESKIVVTNKGFLPANIEYSIVSDDSEVIQPRNQPHVSVEPTKEQNIKILRIKDFISMILIKYN